MPSKDSLTPREVAELRALLRAAREKPRNPEYESTVQAIRFAMKDWRKAKALAERIGTAPTTVLRDAAVMVVDLMYAGMQR